MAERRLLFHGTSDRFLRSVMRRGLLPRCTSGKATYSGKLESHPAKVYLTDIYAIAFGFNAVEANGGRLLVAAAWVDVDDLEPDTDFIEGGRHSSRFTDGLECLKCTGCVAVSHAVRPERLWHFTKKAMEEIRTDASRLLCIDTNLRHFAFREMRQNMQDHFLLRASRYTLRDGYWLNEFGRTLATVKEDAYVC